MKSTLGADTFSLLHLSYAEQLGQLFELKLDLIVEDSDADLFSLLMTDMSVELDLPGDKLRYFHGFVSDVECVGGPGRHNVAHVQLRPWLWFLDKSSTCRIFQEKSVPDILDIVFKEHGFSADVDVRLSGSYRSWEYLVQYQETDANFVTRLMEQEGIYFFFVHEEAKHTLVLADGYGSHEKVPGYETVPYYPPGSDLARERDHLDHWTFSQRIQSSIFSTDDYNFKKPRAGLFSRAKASDDADRLYEVYDYPGEYTEDGEGEGYARLRLEEQRVGAATMRGRGNARGLAAGSLFSLKEFPIENQNQEVLIVGAECSLSPGTVESELGGGEHSFFQMSLTAIKGTTPFRTGRRTPRPVVPGPQTAKVVGKEGQEIWTDEYGRVKVQFPWDREAKGGTPRHKPSGDDPPPPKDGENTSCWIRVSQVMAGAGWGAMHVPRIGQEVIVSFYEGDPDRPVITGRVYNGSNKPPFGLPSKGMVSGIKSDSTPGGGGNNEISLDDTKGKEKINIHGQYDMTTTIEHDQTLTVHNNRTSTIDVNDRESVGADQSVSVGGNQTNTVTGNQTEAITGNQSVTVTGNHSLTVAQASAETIALAKALSVGAGYAITVGAAMNIGVGGALSEEVGAIKAVGVAGDSNERCGGGKSIVAGKALTAQAADDVAMSAGKKLAMKAGTDLAVNAGAKGVIEIKDELTIKVGSAQITLKSNGDITIKGNKITLKGDSDVVVKGSKTGINP